eukprot:TRINITY_DN52177_c0_g1_i1.p2 TRINITY_DN52177_c0_g1~~TRINITY_DN52177_c0_g1_i1.p2  ORF type:complete len:101 (+),score=14.78 TRINITY_DN52177_c0_g1_i1:143-445(+)
MSMDGYGLAVYNSFTAASASSAFSIEFTSTRVTHVCSNTLITRTVEQQRVINDKKQWTGCILSWLDDHAPCNGSGSGTCDIYYQQSAMMSLRQACAVTQF